MVTGTVLACSAMASAQTAGAPAAAPDKDVHVISTQDLDMLRKAAIAIVVCPRP
jgi:hypothetical protein